MKKILSILFALAFFAMTWMVASANESSAGKSPPQIEKSTIAKDVKESIASVNLFMSVQPGQVVDKDEGYMLQAPINEIKKTTTPASEKYRSKSYAQSGIYLRNTDKRSKGKLKKWKDTHRR
jgi:hypothetical protein